MAQLAFHIAPTAPSGMGAATPAAERTRLMREQLRRQRARDRQSLFALAAHTAAPDSEAIFRQSLRNLWAVKSAD